MKLPDLHDTELAGVHAWHGDAQALRTAATAAKLRLSTVNLGSAGSKNDVLAALAKGLALPDHFGNNWDALADSLEDEEWFGHTGRVISITHSAEYRKTHASDWTTLEDIFAEASDYWRERHKSFWVFVD
jgi:hypothetical protein